MLKRFFAIILVFLVGCIDPVDVDMETQRRHLVVEGYFTNLAKLNYVRLTYSQPHSTPYNEFEEHANIFITSQEGESISFYYSGEGYYLPTSPNEIVGVPGKTYTLKIWANGNEYVSEPVKMPEILPVDAVHYEVTEQSFAYKGDRNKKLLPGYNVLVDYQDPAEEKNYLRWSFETQYEVSTQPWDYIDPWTGNPAPKNCCTICYLEEKLELLKVADDRLTNGRKVRNMSILFLPFNQYLNTKNKLTIYQHAITADAYNYFRILEQQKNSTGTVFDPPPAVVKGNMKNTENPAEQVIGFFDVSGVHVQQVTILAKDIPYPVGSFIYPDDCLTIPGSTIRTPPGW